MTIVLLLRRFLALEPPDRWLLVRAYVGLGVVDLALRLLGFRRILEYTNRMQPRVAATGTLPRGERYSHWLQVAARRHVVRARCLHRSLVLHYWLRRDGLPSELRIGVRKEHHALKAHAWVELEGQVVNEPAEVTRTFALLGSPVRHRSA